MFSNSYEASLQSTANAIGVPRDWLFNVISLESNWNADAYNRSGAIGLIQFMPQTLKDMRLLSPSLSAMVPTYGTVPEDVKQAVRAEFTAKFPDVDSQLGGPVQQYFHGRSYPTEQSFYMRVLYPLLVNAPLSQTLPANVQAANPGLKTVGDYVNLVQSRAQTAEVVRKGIPVVAILAGGLALYFLTS